MLSIIVWALLTGLVTGGVWVAIALKRQQRLLSDRQQALLEETNLRLAELDSTYQRLAEVEERLDFAERLLSDGKNRPAE